MHINAHTISRKLTRFRCGLETGFHARYAIASRRSDVRTTPAIPTFLKKGVSAVPYSHCSGLDALGVNHG